MAGVTKRQVCIKQDKTSFSLPGCRLVSVDCDSGGTPVKFSIREYLHDFEQRVGYFITMDSRMATITISDL